MLYIPKVNEYLEILTDAEVKDVLAINTSEYFKSTKEKLYSKLNTKQNIRKVAKSLYISLKTPDGVQSNSSDNCIHLYNCEVLNLFHPELKIKDTESAVQNKIEMIVKCIKAL